MRYIFKKYTEHCEMVISAMEENKLGRRISGFRVMQKGLQFSAVVWEDLTE